MIRLLTGVIRFVFWVFVGFWYNLLFKKNKYVEDFRPVTINATTNIRIQKFIRSKDPLDLK